MLRGSEIATVDAKGRMKIPARYRTYLESEYGISFYVTSIDGAYARIYPLAVWEENEKRLSEMSTLSKPVNDFFDVTCYYGKEVEMDAQGRILLPAELRRDASINGEVKVLGKLFFLEVVNSKDLRDKVEKSRLTPEGMKELSVQGIK